MLFLSNNSIACRKAGKTEKHNKNLCSLNIKISLRTTKDMDLFFGDISFEAAKFEYSLSLPTLVSRLNKYLQMH